MDFLKNFQQPTLFSKLPFLTSVISSINININKFGLQRGLLHIFTNSGIKLSTHNKSTNLIEILSTKKVVVISNHINNFDPLVLLALLPPRNDCFQLTNADYLGIIPNLDAYLIPVYIRHQIAKKKLFISLFLKHIFFNKSLGFEEEKELNTKSIKDARRKLQNGAEIIIFPSPGNKINKERWYRGIGRILENMRNLDEIYIVNVYIKGTTSVDFLRIFPLMYKYFPTIDVIFSEPQIAGKMIEDKMDSYDITKILEDNFNTWVLGFKKLK